MDMICRCSLFTKEMLCLYLIESTLIESSNCTIVHVVISDESYDDSWSSNDVYQSVYRLPIYLTVCFFAFTSQLVCTSFSDIRTVVQALIDVLGNPTELLKAHTAFPHSPGLATLVGRLGSASLSGTGGRGTCTVDLFCMPLNAGR
jgi:hypothetical protein